MQGCLPLGSGHGPEQEPGVSCRCCCCLQGYLPLGGGHGLEQEPGVSCRCCCYLQGCLPLGGGHGPEQEPDVSCVVVVVCRAIFRWVVAMDPSKNQVLVVLLLLFAGLSSVGWWPWTRARTRC